MSDLAPTLLRVLLTPLTFALAVLTAWWLRKRIGDIVQTTGLKEVAITKEGGWSIRFDLEAFAKKAYRKQKMGDPSREDVDEIVTLVRSLTPFVAGRRILWVDNHPENNRLERAALTSWG